MCTAAALTALTGCQSTPKDGRTAGQKVDDDRVNEQVEAALSREPVYKFSNVNVETFDGVVQLSGFVDSEQQKTRAAEVAQQVSGVARIVNSITLKLPQAPTPTGRTNNVPEKAPVSTPSTGE